MSLKSGNHKIECDEMGVTLTVTVYILQIKYM
jgi:hypothetical protein